MPLWRIVPVAQPEDPRWQTGPVWDEVIARAETAAAARVAAAEMEARLYPYNPIRNHAEQQALHFQSSFYDEKLYHVEQVQDPPAGSETGPAAVLEHRLRHG
jgi:hypothetical protein